MMSMTLHITVMDGTTQTWIEEEARRTGRSIELVVESLIQRSVAMELHATRTQQFHDLDSLAGTWSTEEAEAFQAATADFTKIDPGLWS